MFAACNPRMDDMHRIYVNKFKQVQWTCILIARRHNYNMITFVRGAAAIPEAT